MEELVARLLALVDGPGWRGRGARDLAVEQVRAAGTDAAVALLAVRLGDPDPDVRSRAVAAALFVDPGRAVGLVLPLLRDPDRSVRWYTSGCLHDFGDERAVGPLVAVLEGDPDPQVRGAAAYALGGIRSPAAIPALLRAWDADHELDVLGHSASSSAEAALEDILGAALEPDAGHLEAAALERYRLWAAETERLRDVRGSEPGR